MYKNIKPMPHCGNPKCTQGVCADETSDVVRKICKLCEKYELDMQDDPNYIIYYLNGRPIGYDLVETT